MVCMDQFGSDCLSVVHCGVGFEPWRFYLVMLFWQPPGLYLADRQVWVCPAPFAGQSRKQRAIPPQSPDDRHAAHRPYYHWTFTKTVGADGGIM